MARSARLRVPLVAAALSLALAACTDTTVLPEPDGEASPVDGGNIVVPEDRPGGGRRGGGENHQQPVVIVTHATLPSLDISQAVAERVIAGEVGGWSALGAPQGRLRTVAAPGVGAPSRLEAGTARKAVARVVRDPGTVAVVPASAVGPEVNAVAVDGVDPLRSPMDYPLKMSAPECPAKVVTMSVVGDIMLGRGVAAAAEGSGDPAPALRPMQDRLEAADITVGNLENTLSRAGAPTQGDDSFAADPAVARRLRETGFDVLGLANNHLGDFGDAALVETVRLLQGGAIDTFGAGAESLTAWNPAVVGVGDVRFGFIGFNAIGETPEVAEGKPGVVSVSMPPRTGPLDRAELDRFLQTVRRMDGEVDVVVVMPHWGTQYTNVPEPIQRRVAKELAGAGADLVVGGHPHWVQGAEMVEETLVVHSLGNFVFDMDFMEQTQKGLLLELTYWGSELKAADFVPYQMDEDFAPRVVSRERGLETLQLMWETSGPAFSR